MDDFSKLPPLSEIIAGQSARKSLGQHFLLDGVITDRIAGVAGNLREVNVIEIGPGPGGLTRSLLKADAKQLFAIEKDTRWVQALASLQAAANGRLHIIEADALEIDLIERVPAPRKIVANLPYNAGTPMLLAWLDMIYEHGAGAFESLTLMFQKEVAARIVASPGNKDYGRLSVVCQWLCECRWEFELPASAFTPPPKIDSAVITLTPRAKPLVAVDKQLLEKVVAKAFGQRRKMLRAALKGLRPDVDLWLEEAGIDGRMRAEQLDVGTLCRLAAIFGNH